MINHLRIPRFGNSRTAPAAALAAAAVLAIFLTGSLRPVAHSAGESSQDGRVSLVTTFDWRSVPNGRDPSVPPASSVDFPEGDESESAFASF